MAGPNGAVVAFIALGATQRSNGHIAGTHGTEVHGNVIKGEIRASVGDTMPILDDEQRKKNTALLVHSNRISDISDFYVI